MAIFFFAVLGAIIYTYVGYPLLLLAMSKLTRESVHRGDIEPYVSFIIAAHNEQESVSMKLANCLSIDYPEQGREIILVSDGSTDDTCAIAARFTDRGVRCISLPERVGKADALNHGVQASSGDILVFTDMAASVDSDCLRRLLARFADPGIGCVSSEDLVVSSGDSTEGVYVRYEMMLRRLESRVGSCVAASGSLYAMRRDLCPVFPPYAATDMISVLEVVRRGFRAISDPEVRCRMGVVRSSSDEFSRKVRTVLTGVGCMPALLPLLNPLKYGFFSVALFSHKVLRWSGGILLVLLLVSNALLCGTSEVYRLVFGLQIVGYSLALLGRVSEAWAGRYAVIRVPYFFVYTNLSSLVACLRYAAGQRIAVWEPSKRRSEEVCT